MFTFFYLLFSDANILNSPTISTSTFFKRIIYISQFYFKDLNVFLLLQSICHFMYVITFCFKCLKIIMENKQTKKKETLLPFCDQL